jgi:hypothetical protein
MSTTNPAPASPSTASTILTALQTAGGWVTLGVEVAGVVVPLIKALVAKIEQITAPDGTVTYQVLVTADQGELAAVVTLADADLAAINAKLVADGKTPLAIPASPAAPSAGS